MRDTTPSVDRLSLSSLCCHFISVHFISLLTLHPNAIPSTPRPCKPTARPHLTSLGEISQPRITACRRLIVSTFAIFNFNVMGFRRLEHSFEVEEEGRFRLNRWCQDLRSLQRAHWGHASRVDHYRPNRCCSLRHSQRRRYWGPLRFEEAGRWSLTSALSLLQCSIHPR
jgi:hypothetical protein